MKEIAAEILRQLGGNKFIAMTGAKNLAFDDKGTLSFSLPKYAGLKINHVKIELNGKDLYDITFGRIYGTKYSVIETAKDIYNEMLKDVFSTHTGLAVSL